MPAADETMVELESHNAMGFFIAQWTALERLVRELAKKTGTRSASIFPVYFGSSKARRLFRRT